MRLGKSLLLALAGVLISNAVAQAAPYPNDVLLGQPWTASSNWAFLSPAITPGLGYGGPGASITFDLGSVSGKSYSIDGFGIAGEVVSPGRTNWSTVQLEFSDSPTFATETVTNISLRPLGATGVMDTYVLSNIFVGRYARITDTASTPLFTAVYQLSLFVPEPSSLALLAVGGLVVSRVRRRTNAN